MFHPGDTIGPYSLARTLGRGAFGEVWLAERRSSLITTQIALKLPLVEQNALETVRQEAALWVQASGHPNVVPVMDAEVYDGQVVIASEYVAGGSLHEWMVANGGKAPTLEEAIAITSGVLAGLDYLHRVGLTHRDLKPENVLLQDGIPRLTDFGLARVLKGDAQSQSISGTPRYMAPESFSGSYSITSDLWAVGVVLYELITGAHPFPTGYMMTLIVAIQSEEPEPLPDTIPERLRTIVIRLLAKSPADRFVSASAVREALQYSLQPVVSSSRVTPVASSPPHNLPVQPTSFIGREKEIGELKSLLERTHLLTLTGSGGCGKTRLSLQVAEELLSQNLDGVWVVEFAPLADATLVPQTVADRLGIREAPGEPITNTILGSLKGKSLLLVLDNCEHVLEATACLVDLVLRGCPKVKIVVSSREALGIAGESVYRVPSLSLPQSAKTYTPESLSQYEAVHLFIVRAAAVKIDFTVTPQNALALVQLCHRLDGIPLAIELAAARIRSMTVEELDHRLDDRFSILTGGSRTALPRQQTLRATTAWSYDLLKENEKVLLLRLSVFAGGWTLEATEKVCAFTPHSTAVPMLPDRAEFEEWEVLDLLTALVDKSLVVAEEQEPGHTRYRLLETIRQYAGERLGESGEEEDVRQRHRDFFLGFVETAASQLRGPHQIAWFDRLETEHQNLRNGLRLSIETQDGKREDTGLRFCLGLQLFWYIRAHLREGRSWCEAVLTTTTGQGATRMRAEVYTVLGMLAQTQEDYATARTAYEHALAIRRELGDSEGVSQALNKVGWIVSLQGEFALARTLHEESLSISKEIGDKSGIANALGELGRDAQERRDHQEACRLMQEALDIFQEIGDKRAMRWWCQRLGEALIRQGDLNAACEMLERSLALCREFADGLTTTGALHILANIHRDLGDSAVALPMYRESLALRKELGVRGGVAAVLHDLGYLAAKEAKPQRAVCLWAAADTIRDQIGAPLSPDEREEYGRYLTIARQAMSEGTFAAVGAEGRAMTMEQAIEFALGEE